MLLPVATWYGAIKRRHSDRTYNGQPVEKEKLERLEEVCAEFTKPGARAALVTGHIGLGARHAGVNGDWEYLETPEVARFTVK